MKKKKKMQCVATTATQDFVGEHGRQKLDTLSTPKKLAHYKSYMYVCVWNLWAPGYHSFELYRKEQHEHSAKLT